MIFNLGRSVEAKIISSISDKINYLSAIRRKTGITLSASGKAMKRLEKKGFLFRTKESRKKIIQLTKKGKRLKQLTEEIIRL